MAIVLEGETGVPYRQDAPRRGREGGKGVGHVSVRVKQARLDNSVSTISSFRRRVRGSADGTGCFFRSRFVGQGVLVGFACFFFVLPQSASFATRTL